MLSTIAQAHTVTIAWDNPTNNVDGSSLTNFSGNIICYGQSTNPLSSYIDVGNTNRVTLRKLKVNTKYYFYVFSYNNYNHIGLPSDKLKFIIRP